MQIPGEAHSLRWRFVVWAWLYALAITYVSVVVSPLGFHYVALDPAEAWQKFLTIRYEHTGSDQRADWMANLIMLVPFGFLVAGSLWPARGAVRRTAAAVAALALCAAVSSAVKYAQLFFPPRTVSLNYITAQCIGAAFGIAVLGFAYDRIDLLLRRSLPPGRHGLILLLKFYVLALILFFLVPFDIALNPHDLLGRLANVPGQLWMFPGADRSAAIGAVMLAADLLEAAPLGVLLVLMRPRRTVARSAAAGIALMAGVTLASMLLMSGITSLVVFAYRSLGVVIGASGTKWLAARDPARLREGLRRAMPFAAAIYLVLLAVVNGLITHHWRSPQQAFATLEDRGLIPLFYYYIVSKAEAARGLIAHILMYAPIGVLCWMRTGSKNGAGAFFIAMVIATCVEVARWLQPDRQPDINAVLLSGLAAWLAARAAPTLWSMLEQTIAEIAPRRPGTTRVPATVMGRLKPHGDVEQF